MTDENSDRLREMRNLFEIQNEKFLKFYSPSERPAVEEFRVLYKGRVFSDNVYPTNTYVVGIIVYKICDKN